MSLGGDTEYWLASNPNLGKIIEMDAIEHFGTRGMKWGVRKTPAERKAADKAKAAKKADKQKFKLASRLTAGEVVVSALVAGPVGVIGYKAIKRHAAVTKRKNSNLSAEEQTDAAGKLKLGEAVVVTLVSSPVGLVTYAAAKAAAAHQVDEF